ncbi:hypothetical protein KSZ_71070 [Dictyobacter formicarum]|uniref:Uncharacterized protein n=1 Tax=Dictyobacter formicarum TaxID=2778368 RepID=A0ABQ3VVH5_9CHLR|nr:hypothetical protein KSZ_71070 [Dictyobacter formicarum]
MNYLHYLFANSHFFVRRSLSTMTSRTSTSLKTASYASDAASNNAQLAVA